jgi:crotonobetainyl-CoA:carnitine CoA-transferase CaiB-like acyl-CoA transferase
LTDTITPFVIIIPININKYWLGLDLHRTEAQEVFRELAVRSDIIEDNLRPGVMESWNIGYQQIKEINPGIIYISKNGFGQWGQYAEENRPSNDGASQAFSGYAWRIFYLLGCSGSLNVGGIN